MGRSQQKKGRTAELELAKILQSNGYDVRPGDSLNYGREPDLVGLPQIHVECKRCETLRLSEWMAQAERDSKKFQDGLPAVFFRKSREPWFVLMKLGDWMKIYKAQGCRCGGHCAHQKAEETGEKRK